MVLWEITLGTAYFLGLKRTYRLALRLQRRLIGSNHPKIQQFLHRRTHAVFDVAIKVHQNIQQKDLEIGRNLGSWILRWLDRMKPSAQIRCPPLLAGNPSSAGNTTKLESSPTKLPWTFQRSNSRNMYRESVKHFFTSSMNKLTISSPMLVRTILPMRPASINLQYRQLCISGPDMPMRSYQKHGFEGGLIRKDVMEWLLRS